MHDFATNSIFTKSVDIRFRQGDPAGIMFFGNIYQHAHDLYEDFVLHLGFEWKEWFANANWFVPIRHSEAEHLIPIWPGQKYAMRTTIAKIGESSFTSKYAMIGLGDGNAERARPRSTADLKSEHILDSTANSNSNRDTKSAADLARAPVHAEVTLVHTFCSTETKKKISIPADVLSRLQAYQSQCGNT